MPEYAEELSPQLEGVVSAYAAMVRSVVRRKGLPESDADEVLQEVRIRLWKALSTGERIGRVSTSYVYRTAMSAACDVIRRRRIEVTVPGVIEDIPASPAQSPDRTYEREELASRIDQAIRQLHPGQGPVVRMYLAGYPQAEIQALLGWSEPKTRNVLYRGLSQLRGMLQRQGIGPGLPHD